MASRDQTLLRLLPDDDDEKAGIESAKGSTVAETATAGGAAASAVTAFTSDDKTFRTKRARSGRMETVTMPVNTELVSQKLNNKSSINNKRYTNNRHPHRIDAHESSIFKPQVSHRACTKASPVHRQRSSSIVTFGHTQVPVFDCTDDGHLQRNTWQKMVK